MAATAKLRRLRRAPGPRNRGRGRILALVVLAALAVVALLIDGIAGFFLGFAAALVVVDRAWPATGRVAADAGRAFTRERRRRWLDTTRGRLPRRGGGEPALRLLRDDDAAGAEQRALGVRAVELGTIVGSTEPDKVRAFDARFRPPAWTAGRWQGIWLARRRGAALPPIEVFRLGGDHYVRDGHHRVSVARALGETSIDADVVELRPLGAAGDRWYGPGRHR
jgi:hypothetical protein